MCSLRSSCSAGANHSSASIFSYCSVWSLWRRRCSRTTKPSNSYSCSGFHLSLGSIVSNLYASNRICSMGELPDSHVGSHVSYWSWSWGEDLEVQRCRTCCLCRRLLLASCLVVGRYEARRFWARWVMFTAIVIVVDFNDGWRVLTASTVSSWSIFDSVYRFAPKILTQKCEQIQSDESTSEKTGQRERTRRLLVIRDLLNEGRNVPWHFTSILTLVLFRLK